jgi:hypothetical protein
MKKIYLLAFTLLIGYSSIAQTNEKETPKKESNFNTIFHNRNQEKTIVSGFMALNMDFGSINKEFGLLLGIDGAVLINQSFFVGIYGRGLATMPTYNYTFYNKDSSSNISATHRGLFYHGGLLLGYVFYPNKPFHFGISTRIGAGGISLIEDYSYHHKYSPKGCDTYDDLPYIAPLFVFSPQIDAEINITNWMKFRASVGYQYVANSSLYVSSIESGKLIETELLNTKDYNTPTFSIGFVFGWFQ